MDRLTKGKQREETLLRAASEAISELGFFNVRVSDIASRAGMTPGHVTYYFPSKNDLLMLAIRRSEEELIEESRQQLATIADPVERLHSLIASSAAKAPGDEGWALWLQVWASGLADDAVTVEHRQLENRWFDVLVEVIEYGRAQGAFTVSDVSDAAEMISALIDGLSVQLTVGEPRIDRERLLRLCRQGAQRILGLT